MPEQFMAHNGGGYNQNYGGGKPYQQHQQHQQPGQHQQGVAYQQSSGGGYQGGQGQYQGGGGEQQQDPNAEFEAEVKKYLPKVLKVVKRQCCTVM